MATKPCDKRLQEHCVARKRSAVIMSALLIMYPIPGAILYAGLRSLPWDYAIPLTIALAVLSLGSWRLLPFR